MVYMSIVAKCQIKFTLKGFKHWRFYPPGHVLSNMCIRITMQDDFVSAHTTAEHASDNSHCIEKNVVLRFKRRLWKAQ